MTQPFHSWMDCYPREKNAYKDAYPNVHSLVFFFKPGNNANVHQQVSEPKSVGYPCKEYYSKIKRNELLISGHGVILSHPE